MIAADCSFRSVSQKARATGPGGSERRSLDFSLIFRMNSIVDFVYSV